MSNQVILISGGSDGLGRALAMDLSRDNQVIVLARTKSKLAAVAAEVACDFVVADVTKPAEIDQAIQQVLAKYGQIDTLINCAGILSDGPLETISPEEIAQVLAVNNLGTILLTRAVLPRMKHLKNGRIICLGSQAALSARKNRTIYNASKWAVRGFALSLQQEVAEYGITVTAVHPGLLNTDLVRKAGVELDEKRALEAQEVVRMIRLVVETDPKVTLPEVRLMQLQDTCPFE